MTKISSSPRAPGQQPDGVRPARPGRVFTWRDAKELAGAILALWAAGLLIGIFYFAQLQGHIG